MYSVIATLYNLLNIGKPLFYHFCCIIMGLM